MTPPVKRGKASAAHDTSFNSRHQLEYGLKVVGKDTITDKINLIACRFCIAYGVEEKVGAKRQKTVCKKTFGPQFRPENYRSHLTLQHPAKWVEYQLKSDSNKSAFFDVAIPFLNTIVSHMDLERDHITYRIGKQVIEVVIGDMLRNPEDVETFTFGNVMHIFKREEPSGDYAVTIKTPMAFMLAIKHVGIGISMKQTALAIQAAKEVANVFKLSGMNQVKVAAFVRVQCAANFQTISNVLRLVWAFSIALDASICQGKSYVDIRARFVWQRELFNLHVMSVPFFGSHTGGAQFEMLCKLFDVLSPSWKQQLIGASSDGAPNITGAISGVITHLQQASLGGFYRVWCLLHQLDIPLQTAYQKLDQGRWWAALVTMISHLRRQQTLVAEMGSICPKTSTTRWHAMFSATSWITEHRHEIMAHYAEKPAARRASEPTSVVWWILCSVTASITSTIHTVVMRLQGHRLTISQQESIIQKLIVELMLTIGMEWQIGGFPDLDVNVNSIQFDCAAEYSNITAFVQNLGHFEMTWLAAPDDQTRATVLDNIASILFGIVEGVLDCVTLRYRHNDGSDYPAPPTHPYELVKLQGRDIALLVERLDASWTPADIDKIGAQFRALCTAYRTDESLQSTIDACDHTCSFDSAWGEQGLCGRFDQLVSFVGGLTSPFPNTAPVEIDFSILKFRKDAFKKSLTDFSLEGFLQCKQYDMLMRFKQ